MLLIRCRFVSNFYKIVYVINFELKNRRLLLVFLIWKINIKIIYIKWRLEGRRNKGIYGFC